jgi:hypothetical protein
MVVTTGFTGSVCDAVLLVVFVVFVFFFRLQAMQQPNSTKD